MLTTYLSDEEKNESKTYDLHVQVHWYVFIFKFGCSPCLASLKWLFFWTTHQLPDFLLLVDLLHLLAIVRIPGGKRKILDVWEDVIFSYMW